MTATKSTISIKRGDFVVLTSPVTQYNTVVNVGTKCRVWKAKRDGTLYVTPENQYSTMVVDKNNVTKINSPKANVKVGDIFYTSWGYDQTNIDFYKIVAVKNKTISYVSIGEDRTYTGPMQGTVVPNINHIGTNVKNARILVDGNGTVSFKVTNYSWAYPYNGQPKSFTEWA